MKFKLLLAALALVGFGAIGSSDQAAAQFAPQVCHNDPQLHYHPQVGYTWHRHVGRNCTPVRASAPIARPPRDCHRDAERHYIPGRGTVWHRHVGPNCAVQVLRQSNRRQGSSCVQVGPIWWCP
jgi:hypothetical protein